MKNKNGFTLIELLVVISLIGVLATLVIANMNSARERARDTTRKSDLRNIQTALRLYYNDKGSYPASIVFGAAWADGSTTYMNLLPDDPLAPAQNYTYTLSATDTDDYTIKACLENKSDEKCTAVASTVCASLCKYEVRP